MISGRISGQIMAPLAGAAISAAGCGSEMPLDMVSLHGNVVYQAGGLIPAEGISVRSNPIDVWQRLCVSGGGQVVDANEFWSKVRKLLETLI